MDKQASARIGMSMMIMKQPHETNTIEKMPTHDNNNTLTINFPAMDTKFRMPCDIPVISERQYDSVVVDDDKLKFDLMAKHEHRLATWRSKYELTVKNDKEGHKQKQHNIRKSVLRRT